MNFNRNVSCLIAVDVFMDNDFFNQTVEGGSVQPVSYTHLREGAGKEGLAFDMADD